MYCVEMEVDGSWFNLYPEVGPLDEWAALALLKKARETYPTSSIRLVRVLSMAA